YPEICANRPPPPAVLGAGWSRSASSFSLLPNAAQPGLASVCITPRVRLPIGWPHHFQQLPRPAKSRVRLSSPLGWQPSRLLADRAEGVGMPIACFTLGPAPVLAVELARQAGGSGQWIGPA